MTGLWRTSGFLTGSNDFACGSLEYEFVDRMLVVSSKPFVVADSGLATSEFEALVFLNYASKIKIIVTIPLSQLDPFLAASAVGGIDFK